MCVSHILPNRRTGYIGGVDDASRFANLVATVAVALADQVREAAEAASGLSGAGPAALVMLAQSLRGGTMDDLRRAIGLTPSGAVRLVDRLVADGLVERRAGADQRSLALVPTRSGRAAARRIAKARAAVVTTALRDIPADEQETLGSIVEQLTAAITMQRLEGRGKGQSPAGGGLGRR
jgi:MarR family transcriptional regulator, negative regulator of the multidrug operon emrRAB